MPLGGKVELGVVRGGKESKVAVALETAPESPRDEIVIEARSPFLGAKVANLSPALADELRLDRVDRGRRRGRNRRRHAGAAVRLPARRHRARGQRRQDRQDRAISKAPPRPAPASGASPSSAAASRFQPCSADDASRAQTRRRAEPVRGGGARQRRAAAAGRQAAPAEAGRRGRPGSSARAGRRADPHARQPLARLADLLGAARHRQDHGGAAAGARNEPRVRADQRDLLRRRRT